MKKLLSLILVLSMLFAIVSCGKKEPEKKPILSSINGVSLDNYSIVYSDEDHDYSKRAAEYIQTKVLERCEIELPLVEDSAEAATEYEIVVGNTEREISERLDADTEGMQFAILSEEKQIALEGDYFIIAAAAYYFVHTYIPVADYQATVPAGVSIHEPIVKKAKNFIMLIGDGMGVYQSQMFDYLENTYDYSDGEDIFYGYYFPYQGYSRTDSLSGTTDSAAGGTALSTGYKTFNERIGRDKDGKDLKSLTELAIELGMSAGVMSTEVQTGATPASFSAHANSRHDTDAIFKSIQETKTNIGTIVDCSFDQYNKRGIEKIVEKHITTTLNTLDDNPNGFFLMYEEAHIDKHSHNNELDKTFSALVRFNQAIGRFMEFAFYNPDTFVLITADHETGSLKPDENGVLQYGTTVHSSANVKIFAYGQGAEVFDDVRVENIQIAHTIASYMGDDHFGDQSKFERLNK